MALNKPLETVKEDFEAAAKGRRTLTPPKGPRVKKGSDDDASTCKILAFGPTGSGKTRMLVGLLLHGLKIFVISTDFGGEGLDTVKLEIKRLGRYELLDNYKFVVLTDYSDVETFVQNPAKIYPEIYDDGFDFLVWDGFTGFQQTTVSDYIGKMTPAGADKEGKVVSDGREAGLVFEQQDWGAMRNATIRPLDKFLKLYNLKTGGVYHKLVTCLEGIKSSKSGSGADARTTYVDTKEPMLQGAAQRLIGPAFDLILNTRIMAPDGKEEGRRAYKYICAGHDLLSGAKTRGLELPPVMEGDMFKLWEMIAEQKGIKHGAISADFEEEKTNSVS